MLTTVAAGRVYDYSYCIGRNPLLMWVRPAGDFGLPKISSWGRWNPAG